MSLRQPQSDSVKPLVVDLDGSLLRSDLLYESFFDSAALGVGVNIRTAQALLAGKAAVKHHLANESDLDYATLPYDSGVLDLIREAKAKGRKVYLATASNEKHARAVAEHLGVFDGWFASDSNTNLSGDKKAKALVDALGEKEFDYLGNGAVDLPVWQHADNAYGLGLSHSVKRRLTALKGDYVELTQPKSTLRTWLEALRVHQYVKNVLVFVPLLTSHQFEPGKIGADIVAFVAFCVGASAVYMLNDLLDLKADRTHPTKRNRPFARGSMPLRTGLLLIPALLALAIALAATVSMQFLGVLLCYFILTTAYSVYLKRKMLVDVVALAMLYTLRIIAGGVAADIQISQWLFIFSVFIFTSLALMKRYVELSTRLDRELPDPSDRNYRIGDLDVVAALAAAAGMNAITIFALYVTSPDVQPLYRHPKALWLICPILLYWIGRALMMAHRRLMDTDPIVFALKDRISAIAIVLILAIVIVAI